MSDLNFGLARKKYPHDIVEFIPERKQIVVRSQPMRTLNYVDYGNDTESQARISYDDPYIVSKRARENARRLILGGASGFSRWNPATKSYD